MHIDEKLHPYRRGRFIAPTADDERSHPRSATACHPERSEGSDAPGTEILRCAQDDRTGFDGEHSSSALTGCYAVRVKKLIPIIMPRKTYLSIPLMLLLIALSMLLACPTHVYASPKARLTLNLHQGPLGVTLTLSGDNFTPGPAALSYIDSHNIPGTFTPPGDTSVQVQIDGTFSTSNLVMPGSGPVGPWTIIVTDSIGKTWTVPYLVLAAPGQQTAGVPSLALDPPSASAGDTVAFTGSNWLPQGTAVTLSLLADTTSLPLLATPPQSDRNGQITGTFHLPASLDQSEATVSAADASTGALRAQAQIFITLASPTPSTSPTPAISPTPTATSTPAPTAIPTITPTASSSTPGGVDNTGGPLSAINGAIWGPLLLIISALLALAALMMVLFLIPAQERRRRVPWY